MLLIETLRSVSINLEPRNYLDIMQSLQQKKYVASLTLPDYIG